MTQFYAELKALQDHEDARAKHDFAFAQKLEVRRRYSFGLKNVPRGPGIFVPISPNPPNLIVWCSSIESLVNPTSRPFKCPMNGCKQAPYVYASGIANHMLTVHGDDWKEGPFKDKEECAKWWEGQNNAQLDAQAEQELLNDDEDDEDSSSSSK